MLDAHYQDSRLCALYDLDSGWSADRDFYLALAGASRRRILDLGCGTGLLCDAYAARGHRVTGVDPAAAMLDVARKKPHAAAVDWRQASAEAFRSRRRFDLIVMTGHAFQVLLDDAAVCAALSTMRRHLGAHGRIVFESRNPAIDWRRRWDYDLDLDLDGRSVRETRRLLAMDGDRLSFELRYALAGETLTSNSTLRFLPRHAIERQLAACGLRVEALLGDWDGRAFEARSSQEMIFVVAAA